MPFTIIRNDITKVHADAIVNTANPHARIGSGTDHAIYQAAGAEAMLAERRRIGDIPVGKAAATPAFALPAKYVIHTVGPSWVDGEHGEREALRSCYQESLAVAEDLGCASVAFPLIATGVYGFPKDLALRTATDAIYDFLLQSDMTVYLVVFDRHAFDLSGKLFSEIHSYIDEHYVLEQAEAEYLKPSTALEHHASNVRGARGRRYLEHLWEMAESADKDEKTAAQPSQPAVSLGDWLDRTGESFSDHLIRLINERNLTNPEVYNAANITKQHYSKLISGKGGTPKKNTVCALALALRLTLPEAQALLASAGYALNPSSQFDLAVEYFLKSGKYNVVNNNIELFECGLDLLGTQ